MFTSQKLDKKEGHKIFLTPELYRSSYPQIEPLLGIKDLTHSYTFLFHSSCLIMSFSYQCPVPVLSLSCAVVFSLSWSCPVLVSSYPCTFLVLSLFVRVLSLSCGYPCPYHVFGGACPSYPFLVLSCPVLSLTRPCPVLFLVLFLVLYFCPYAVSVLPLSSS